MTPPAIRPSQCPVSNAAITRVWKPANGTLTARIPAIAFSVDALIAAGEQAATKEHVA